MIIDSTPLEEDIVETLERIAYALERLAKVCDRELPIRNTTAVDVRGKP